MIQFEPILTSRGVKERWQRKRLEVIEARCPEECVGKSLRVCVCVLSGYPENLGKCLDIKKIVPVDIF